MMGEQRASIFGGDDDALDLSAFQPKKPERPAPAVAEQAAAKAGFKSREPKTTSASAPDATATPAAAPAAARQQRRYRTGRNAQFNLKAKPETIADFIAIADAQGWVLGEALEKAVELLQKQYGGDI